jgi:translin|tara:strand:- start:370 stop:1002 length:633 start_codon:yes stop_codon:yes gene_type:complete
MSKDKFMKSLERIAKELDMKISRRENLLKESRAAIALSSRAIVNIHTGKKTESEKELMQNNDLLIDLRKIAEEDLKRYLIPPETEYAEAMILRAISADEDIPSQKILKVGNEGYILGLLDAVGEIKRMVYDSLRKGEVTRASDLFELMEEIYTRLSPYAVYDHIIQGVRRKLDVSRILVENTRAAITEEVRRMEFLKGMTSVANKQSKNE